MIVLFTSVLNVKRVSVCSFFLDITTFVWEFSLLVP